MEPRIELFGKKTNKFCLISLFVWRLLTAKPIDFVGKSISSTSHFKKRQVVYEPKDRFSASSGKSSSDPLKEFSFEYAQKKPGDLIISSITICIDLVEQSQTKSEKTQKFELTIPRKTFLLCHLSLEAHVGLDWLD